MKKIFITFLFPASVFAQQEISSNAILKSVIVYNSGAELTHTGKAYLPSGVSKVFINNVSGTLNENTIQVGISTGVSILSVQFNKDFLNKEAETPAVQKINDSLKVASSALTKIQTNKEVEQNTLSLLDDNRKSGGANTGINVDELSKLANYYRTKSLEIKEAIVILTEKEAKQNQKIAALNKQLAELRNNNSSQLGQIVLQVMSKTNSEITYDISYLCNKASWIANYDLKAEHINMPLALVYKADVMQSTGLDWKKVKLALSTGSPSSNVTAPVLSPWFLSTYSLQKPELSEISLNESIKIKGYSSLKQSVTASTLNAYTSVNESQLGFTFNIDLPYDINSDNKPHGVSLKEYQVAATYRYYAAPRLSPDAFLLAEITDWEKLSLLPGNANIIFEGTYTGRSFINPASTRDTLNLSMGKDKKIIIEKEKLSDFSSTKFIGNFKKQVFTYEFKIRNTKKEAVLLQLKDQYPISTENDIETELIESSNALVNKDSGVLSWTLNVLPGETQTVRLSYSVKYPKNKTISNL